MCSEVSPTFSDFEEVFDEEGKVHDVGILKAILADGPDLSIGRAEEETAGNFPEAATSDAPHPGPAKIYDKPSPSTLCCSLCPASSADTPAETSMPGPGG